MDATSTFDLLDKLRPKLISNMADRLFGLEQPTSALRKMLEEFCKSSDGGSCLISGQGRTGKTTVVERVLRDHFSDRVESTWVNGLDYSDANDAAPLKLIQKEGKESRRIVVIDHFEHFTRRNQVVLYHVLNQSQNSPIFVVLICERQDCLNLLEKRVRSRLSNKRINFDVPVTFEDYSAAFFDLIGHAGNKAWTSHAQQLQNDEIMCKSLETAYEVDHRYASVKSLATLFVTLSDGSPELMPFVVNAVIGQEDGMENVAQGLSMRQVCLMQCLPSSEGNYKQVTDKYKSKTNTKFCELEGMEDAVLHKDLDELTFASAIARLDSDVGQDEFRRVHVNMDLSLLPECPFDRM